MFAFVFAFYVYDSCSQEGFQPLHYSAIYGGMEIAEALISLGADVFDKKNVSMLTVHVHGCTN